MGHDPLAVRIELENTSSMLMVLLPGIMMNPNSSVAPHWCGNLLRRRRGGGCSVRSSAASAGAWKLGWNQQFSGTST
jgi:hypothetical protein